MNDLLTRHDLPDVAGVPMTTIKNWLYHPDQKRPDFPRPIVLPVGPRYWRAYWVRAEVEAWRARNVA